MLIEKIFNKSKLEFRDKEIDLIHSGVSERTLCGAFAQILNANIKNSIYNKYHTDVEYNRNNGKIKTIVDGNENIITINCDLIVHSRGENPEQDNLLAIEMKKSNRPETEKHRDKERLKALTMDSYDDVWSYDGKTFPEHVCGYLLGVYIEFNLKYRTIFLVHYEKGRLTEKYEMSI